MHFFIGFVFTSSLTWLVGAGCLPGSRVIIAVVLVAVVLLEMMMMITLVANSLRQSIVGICGSVYFIMFFFSSFNFVSIQMAFQSSFKFYIQFHRLCNYHFFPANIQAKFINRHRSVHSSFVLSGILGEMLTFYFLPS